MAIFNLYKLKIKMNEREREVRTGERKDEEIRGGRAVVENRRELGKRKNG